MYKLLRVGLAICLFKYGVFKKIKSMKQFFLTVVFTWFDSFRFTNIFLNNFYKNKSTALLKPSVCKQDN